MAFTEKYVTSAAGGGGTGGSGDPWTLAEAFANATAGDRVNIQSDAGYSIGATTITNAGTVSSLVVYRGYNSSIGDLEGQGRNADGTLDTTNFPAITLTGTLTCKAFICFESLAFSGAISNTLIGTASLDDIQFLSCSFTNSQNHAAARCLYLDEDVVVVNSDVECSGASHGAVVTADNRSILLGCRIKGVANSPLIVTPSFIKAVGVLFIGNNTGTGIQQTGAVAGSYIGNCTFYNLGTAIECTSASPSAIPVLINNHATDCSKWLDYTGGGTLAVIEVNNRTRDNTTPRTGIGDGVNMGEITTDTGGPETDYTDHSSDNFRLITGAPGKAAGIVAYTDCGAYQREEEGSVETVRPSVLGSS